MKIRQRQFFYCEYAPLVLILPTIFRSGLWQQQHILVSHSHDIFSEEQHSTTLIG